MKKSIYIFSNGEMQRKDNTLFFESEDGQRKYVPVEDTSELMIFGEVSFNKKLLEYLSQKEIIMHYFNYYGYYMGTFYPREHLNSGYMIIQQASHYADDSKRLTLAHLFVSGSLQNIQKVLKYYQGRDKNVAGYLDKITSIDSELPLQITIEQLMAKEGEARQLYYKAFDAILNHEDFEFDKRTRRPPQNNLNTLISFLNVILYTTVLSEIYQTHLDPRIGFLHTSNFRRVSLNLDVAEIFKPVIVDRVIFTLIGKKMIQAKHFEKSIQGISLTSEGKKIVITEFDEKLKDTLSIKDIDKNVSYRRLIRLELYKLEKHLMGEKEYAPFISRW